MFFKINVIYLCPLRHQIVIRMTQNSMYDGKSRHIHLGHNIIEYLLSNGNIMDLLTICLLTELVYISSR